MSYKEYLPACEETVQRDASNFAQYFEPHLYLASIDVICGGRRDLLVWSKDAPERKLVGPSISEESSDGGPTQSLRFSFERCNSKDFSTVLQTSKQTGL